MMPRIAEIREIDGCTWVRLVVDGKPEGTIMIWDSAEIRECRIAAVRDFFIDQFNAWKDRQL
jgi:hypothetical protein